MLPGAFAETSSSSEPPGNAHACDRAKCATRKDERDGTSRDGHDS